MLMAVSVIVATRDRPTDLQRCVKSILDSAFRDFELLVVDQSSDKSLADFIQSLADCRVKYMYLDTPGKARSLNTAVRASAGDILCFTDDDCEVSRDWLSTTVSFFERHPEVSMVFGTLKAIPHDQSKYFVPFFDAQATRFIRRPIYPLFRVGFGANMSLRRTSLLELGGFNELVGPGAPSRSGDDIELAYRALTRGYTVATLPESIVIHWGARAYDSGAVRRLIFNNRYGLGFWCMWHAKRRDTEFLKLFAVEFAIECKALLRNILSGRRPIGLHRMRGLLQGSAAGLRAA
jgi:glycosyltransferase involved in cell wall biosynthesis